MGAVPTVETLDEFPSLLYPKSLNRSLKLFLFALILLDWTLRRL